MQELRNVRLGAREVGVRLSAGAVAALTRQNEELYIEMELYFSCLVGKRVNFLPALSRTSTSRAPNRTLRSSCIHPPALKTIIQNNESLPIGGSVGCCL